MRSAIEVLDQQLKDAIGYKAHRAKRIQELERNLEQAHKDYYAWCNAVADLEKAIAVLRVAEGPKEDADGKAEIDKAAS